MNAATYPSVLQKFLSSPPPLINGEDAEVYEALRNEVHNLVQPKDLWDQMMVKDVTNHFWLQTRYQRSMEVIINIHQTKALEYILREELRLPLDDAEKLADAFLSFDREKTDLRPSASAAASPAPKTREEVVALLTEFGLDESCIGLLAVQESIGTLRTLEDLALRHELRREQILQEVERRRNQRSAQMRSSGDTLITAQLRALPKKPRSKSA
jgi:hypothetical protein